MQIHTEFRGIPANFTAKNTTKFRGIPYVFQKIPYSVGSQKRTSMDTLLGMEILPLGATRVPPATNRHLRDLSAISHQTYASAQLDSWDPSPNISSIGSPTGSPSGSLMHRGNVTQLTAPSGSPRIHWKSTAVQVGNSLSQPITLPLSTIRFRINSLNWMVKVHSHPISNCPWASCHSIRLVMTLMTSDKK